MEIAFSELRDAATLPQQRDLVFRPKKLLIIYGIMHIFGVAILFRHRGLHIFRIFLSLKLHSIAPLSLSRS